MFSLVLFIIAIGHSHLQEHTGSKGACLHFAPATQPWPLSLHAALGHYPSRTKGKYLNPLGHDSAP